MTHRTFSSFFSYKQSDFPECIRVSCDYLTFTCSSEKTRLALHEIILSKFENLTQHKIRYGKLIPSLTGSNPFCIFHELEIYRLKTNFLSLQYKLSFPGKPNIRVYDLLFDFPALQNFSILNNVKISKIDFKIETLHNIVTSFSAFLDTNIVTQMDDFCVKQQLIEATFLHGRILSRSVNMGGYHVTLKNTNTPTVTKIYIRNQSKTVSLEITIRGGNLPKLTELWLFNDFDAFMTRVTSIFITRTRNLYPASFLANSKIMVDSIIAPTFFKQIPGLVFSSKNRYKRVLGNESSASFLCHLSSDYYHLIFFLFLISDLIKNSTENINITFKIKAYLKSSEIKKTKRHTNEFKLFIKRLAFTTYFCNENSTYCYLISNLKLKTDTVTFVLNFNTFNCITSSPSSSPSAKTTRLELLEIYTSYHSFFKKSTGNHPKYLLCLFLQAKYSTVNRARFSSFIPKSKKNREMLVSTVHWLFPIYSSEISFEETNESLLVKMSSSSFFLKFNSRFLTSDFESNQELKSFDNNVSCSFVNNSKT
jgi:hypothetical protein